MTQEEITAIIAPISKVYNEAYAKLHSIKVEDYPNEQLFERHRENLLGKTAAYQDVISSLQSVHMKIALNDLEVTLSK